MACSMVPATFPVIVDVDQHGRPFHLDARDTRGQRRVVLIVLTSQQRHSVGDDEVDVTFEEQRAGCAWLIGMSPASVENTKSASRFMV